MYQTLVNTPLIINLPIQAKSTGWTVNGTIATHEVCNAGKLTLLNYSVVPNQSYTLTYNVISIDTGYVQLFVGGVGGAQLTTPGFHVETIQSNGTQVWFYSNANCQIELLNIQVVLPPISQYQQNTIAFNHSANKWASWYTFVPEMGVTLFTDTITFNNGTLYLHQHNSGSRCIFYGNQYPATIIFTTNQQPTIAKVFNSINYQANQLLVTPSMGVDTSLGQVSELITQDFLVDTLVDGIQSIPLYSSEGLYKATFLRDMNVDIINGDILQGNWLKMGLQTTSPSVPMNLFTTEIGYSHSYNNIR